MDNTEKKPDFLAIALIWAWRFLIFQCWVSAQIWLAHQELPRDGFNYAALAFAWICATMLTVDGVPAWLNRLCVATVAAAVTVAAILAGSQWIAHYELHSIGLAWGALCIAVTIWILLGRGGSDGQSR